MASLFVVRGQDQGKQFSLSGGVSQIGRGRSNEIQLHDSESSRQHAEIKLNSDGKFELSDLQSSNGTTVNGQRIEKPIILRSGDRIEVGSTLFVFTGSPHRTTSTTGSSNLVGPPTKSAWKRFGQSPTDHSFDFQRPAADQPPQHGVDITQYDAADESRIVASFDQSLSQLSLPGDQDRPGRATSDADRSLEVMYLTAIAVGRTDDLSEVLDRVLRLVFDWVEADRGCIMLRDHASGQLRPAARCDRDAKENQAREQPISISQTILQWVLEKKQGVRTSDARDDVRFESAASIVTGGVREALCVPLQGRYAIVGALYVDTYTTPAQMMARHSSANPRDNSLGVSQNQSARFTDDHLRLITAIGHQAALAIEDTTYYSALVQSERLAVMGQTIATLSHHIKNILQGISGGSYLIEAGLQKNDTDAVRRGWNIVDRNQERISNLVMDMLTFSKERDPQRVEGDLNATVRDVVELMNARAGELRVQLRCELGINLPTASFDPDGLHRALMNLVTNAIDAASGGQTESDSETCAGELATDSNTGQIGKVLVRTRFDQEAGFVIDVIDNGPGVAPEDRESIFSLFESRKGMRGTGLGLPVSAKILEEHGGSIQVLPNSDSSGACFRMLLPATGPPADETRIE